MTPPQRHRPHSPPSTHSGADAVSRLRFFLGGGDLEMVTIRDLILQHRPDQLFDRQLTWGAKASAYRDEVSTVSEAGLVPVFIELENDLEATPADAIWLDHHGDRAGHAAATALEQIFALLGCPRATWTRWYQLVAANDRAHIAGLLSVGATPAEVVEIRRADFAAQGVSAEEFAAAAAAAKQRATIGNLEIVTLPNNRASVVADILHKASGGPGYDNLLVVCPAEVDFYGTGASVNALDAAFAGGWKGGDLPVQGFWGHNADSLAATGSELISHIAGLVNKSS